MKWKIFKNEKPTKAGRYLVDTGEQELFYYMTWQNLKGSFDWYELGYSEDIDDYELMVSSETIFAWLEIPERII